MGSGIWIVVSTVEGEDVAGRLARGSVTAGLAACAQVEGPMVSHYVWKGRAEESRENRIVFKTQEAKVQTLISWLRKNHPYEVPEILAWQAEQADPDYADWVLQA